MHGNCATSSLLAIVIDNFLRPGTIYYPTQGRIQEKWKGGLVERGKAPYEGGGTTQGDAPPPASPEAKFFAFYNLLTCTFTFELSY